MPGHPHNNIRHPIGGVFCYTGTMKITPLRDIVLIKVDPVKDKTASGLYIAEEWKSLPPVGTVEAVGPEVTKVKVGDRVMFNRYGSVILENNLRLCQEAHCYATI